MKKKNVLLSVASLALLSSVLTACPSSKKIIVWVGDESATFYSDVCNEFLEANPDFGYKIEVKGVDTGTVAGTITSDADSAGDIYTVAHDNIGKMVAGNFAKPITEDSLVAQAEADNPDSFKAVMHSVNPADSKEYLYGIPYISQALFLYYDTTKVTEEQAKTFEGLTAAAKAANAKATTVVGDDGFNNSFTLLSTKVSDHSTSLKLYEGATTKSKGECNAQGDSTIASLRWLQDSYADANGFTFASEAGWEQDFKNHKVVSVIGGAWHYNAAESAVGSANLGVALIPTFTITEGQANGLATVAAGDVYRGGTFADCKVFMINGHSKADKYVAEQQLLKFLSSKDIQKRSFEKCSNVPAYKGASDDFETMLSEGKITRAQYNLASVQVQMAEWGIPQPFITGTLNTYYYSKQAPSVYKAMIQGKNYPETGTALISNTKTLEGVRQGLYFMEYIWMHGKNPETIPTTLPTKA